MQPENDSLQKNYRPGALTGAIGKQLRAELEPRGYQVYYDHPGASETLDAGRIVSWLGKERTRGDQLSFLDIAIVDPKTQNVLVLLEIEETTDKPKTLLGDVFAALMGESVRFGRTPLIVGSWTTLIVLGRAPGGQGRRPEGLTAAINRVKPHLGTKNASIGRIVVDSFRKGKLEDKLDPHVEAAIAVGAIRQRFDPLGQVVEIPLQKAGAFGAKLVDGGIEVDNLGIQPFLPWDVFAETMILLIRNGGSAERGDAMSSRLGDPGLSLDSIEGHIAHVVYGREIGDSVFRRISPIAAILVWAGLCDAAPGKLVLRR